MPQLGDILAGAAGSPINRPALDAYVTQGQAMAGLRTAQTEQALLNAKQLSDEQQASDGLTSALGGLKNPDGSPMLTPSEVTFTATQMKATHGSALAALQALHQMQVNNSYGVVANANADPNSRLANIDAMSGKIQSPYTQDQGQLVNNLAPGAANAPNVTQTPASVATENLHNAQAELAQRHAENPQAFNSNALTPAEIAAVDKYIKANPSAAPTGYSITRPAGAAIAASLAPPPAAPNADSHPGPAPLPNVSYNEQAAIRKDFASGTAAKQTTSLNTMYLHSQLFDQIANQLQNGSFAPTNQINVLWQRLFGGPAPANLNTAAQFLGREAVRATVNSGAGTGEERELQVGPTASPDQLHGVADTLRSLAGGQLMSLERRAARGGVDITQLLDPQVVAGYGRAVAQSGMAAAHAQQTPPAGGNAPPISLLAEGKATHFGNGQTWTIRNGVPMQIGANGMPVQQGGTPQATGPASAGPAPAIQ